MGLQLLDTEYGRVPSIGHDFVGRTVPAAEAQADLLAFPQPVEWSCMRQKTQINVCIIYFTYYITMSNSKIL